MIQVQLQFYLYFCTIILGSEKLILIPNNLVITTDFSLNTSKPICLQHSQYYVIFMSTFIVSCLIVTRVQSSF